MKHHIIHTDQFRKPREPTDTSNTFDIKKCFSTVFKKLSLVDVVIVEGQDLDLLSASLDLLFIMNIPDETCKERYFLTTDNMKTIKQSQHWRNFVSDNWNRQCDVFKQLSTNQNGPCQKVNYCISDEKSIDQIISTINMYITVFDK